MFLLEVTTGVQPTISLPCLTIMYLQSEIFSAFRGCDMVMMSQQLTRRSLL